MNISATLATGAPHLALAVPFKQYIDGAWRDGSGTGMIEDTDPYTGDLLGRITSAGMADVEAAYAAAARAQREWEHALPRERAAVFRKAMTLMEANRDAILNWLIRESGSTRIKAELEFANVHAQMAEATSLPYRMTGQILPVDMPGKESRVERRPVGVVGIISPWNWPLTLTNRSAAPALALGNAVVIKPADETLVTGGLLLAWLYEAAGLPKGLLNVIVGDVAQIGDGFVTHDVPRVISFTGSTGVGRRIARLGSDARVLKHVALELGGNAPMVILDDADLDRAVDAAIFGRFLHQGQICMSTNRIIVDETIADRFTDAFVARAAALKCGDPNDPDTAIGPIISQRHLDRLSGVIAEARAAGLTPLLAGEPQGLVMPPHVFGGVANDCALAQGEIFGPVVPVIRSSAEAEALRLANATEYGLSSSVFSQDEGRALRFARKLDAGMTHINDVTVNSYPNNPFGGEKNSGVGRFGGDWVIREFTSDHWISVQHEPRKYPF